MKDLIQEYNKELMQTKDEDRTLRFWDYVILWAGMTINIAAFSVGAQLYPGLRPIRILWAIFIAYTIVVLLISLNGDIGTKYGLPFIIYIRRCFGYKGAHIAGFIRCLPCFFWFGYQTWVGAIALNEMLKIIIGYSNVMLLILIFAAVQIANALYGLESMAKFDWIAVPSLAIVLGGMVFYLLKVNNTSLVDIMALPSTNKYSMAFAITGISGGWITMTLNGPDLTRQIKRSKNYQNESFFVRNKTAILGQILGLIFVGALVLIAGMVSGILTGNWNPVDVIAATFQSNTLIVIICLIAVLFAQWSTNTAANLMPPSLILLNFFPKLNLKGSTILAGIIGILIMPWKFSAYLVWVQALSSALLGPIVGVILADYYLIHKTEVDVSELYYLKGKYRYTHGFHLKAFLALGLSFLISIFTGDYAFFVGLITSTVLYYLFVKNFKVKDNKK